MTPFDAIADPTRRTILNLLLEQNQTVGELVAQLDISQPGVSRHLRVLREAGLVEAKVDAQWRRYQLRAEGLRQLDSWLANYRHLWEARLDRFGSYVTEQYKQQNPHDA